MNYHNIRKGKFINRPNRFIANIELDGTLQLCHVKNTGRCEELLIKDVDIFVEESDKLSRKTKYDLISVYKGNRLINMDSMAPNKVFHEWLLHSNFIKNITLIRPECTHNDSRFDFYIETKTEKIFIEVKGVTLEEDGVVLFPDAPTERGVKHLNGLINCVTEGYLTYVVFMIQMKDVLYFTPNEKKHQLFADTLKLASQSGVNIIALDCCVTMDSITAAEFVEIQLSKDIH